MNAATPSAAAGAPAYPARPGAQFGRFHLRRELGRGGMGVVFEAIEQPLGRRVAIKVIAPAYAGNPEFRHRFEAEAQALASLDSPHVVRVYAVGEEQGCAYLVTQLVEGGDLAGRLTCHGAPSVGEALALVEQVAWGLADVHHAGLVHRDVKPGNVLVRTRDGVGLHAYLADFGVAERVGATPRRLGAEIVGTPTYLAPELHSGAPAAVASDIYALGCLLWVTLTGRLPFDVTSYSELLVAHARAEAPQLGGRSPLVAHIDRIVRTAMAKAPADRYPSAQALRDDLRAAAFWSDDPAYRRTAALQGTGQRLERPTARRQVNAPV